MTAVGIDDTSTSFQRGQSYVTAFADLREQERRVVFVTEGRDHETVEQFAGFLGDHGGDSEAIAEVCQDMSEAYQKGVREHLPNAEVSFDRFRVKQKLSTRSAARSQSTTSSCSRTRVICGSSGRRTCQPGSRTGSISCSRRRYRPPALTSGR